MAGPEPTLSVTRFPSPVTRYLVNAIVPHTGNGKRWSKQGSCIDQTRRRAGCFWPKWNN